MSEAFSDLVDSVKHFVEDLPQWAKIGIAGAVIIIPSLSYFQKKARKSPYKSDWEADVVYLYQFPRAATIPNVSNFCIKLETWLRMANINYKSVDIPLYVRSKEGMLPFVEFNGVEYADSNFIMRDLTELLKKESMEAHLSGEQRGAARAIEQMIENTTTPSYALKRYGECINEMFSERVAGARMLKQIPFIMKMSMNPWLMTRMIRKRLVAHGIGRHSDEEIVGIGLTDLDALSAYLGDKLYLTGTKPVRADATVFGLLSQLMYVPIDTPHTAHIKAKLPNLAAYAERMKTTFWPDWEETCATGDLNTDWRSTKYKTAATPPKRA